MQHQIDDIDKKILNILQVDATLPLKNIAEQVRASVATCQRRIQLMIESGVITKQVAVINPMELGFSVSAFISVVIEKQNNQMKEDFECLVSQLPNVMNCYQISGDFDFLLLVHAKNMTEFYRFTREYLTSDNNVRRFKSQFIMNFAKVESKITLK